MTTRKNAIHFVDGVFSLPVFRNPGIMAKNEKVVDE